jgi:hypothetical protein
MTFFQKIFSRRPARTWMLLALGLLVAAQAGYLLSDPRTVPPAKAFSVYAEEVVKQCATANYRPSCYDKEIPKLTEELSMEDSFKVVRIVQDLDKSYAYCHVLGHEISAREVAKDPSKWKEVVTRCPSGVCSNGCIHGGFQERFRAESFTDAQIETHKAELYDLCEPRGDWRPTGLEQGSCYHALGHLTMYLASADIRKSLDLCAEVTKAAGHDGFDHLCFDGAFMQIYQPLEPEDFALIKGKEQTLATVEAFCDGFTGEERSSCRTESWPLYRADLQDPKYLTKFCAYLDGREEDRCYSTLIYVLTAQMNLEPKKVRDYCVALPAARQGICFANGASRLIEVDYRNATNAATICASAKEVNPKASEQCFNDLLLYSTYNYHAGSPEFFALCNELPSPWHDRCLAKAPSR